jgi:hypothetical protein
MSPILLLIDDEETDSGQTIHHVQIQHGVSVNPALSFTVPYWILLALQLYRRVLLRFLL